MTRKEIKEMKKRWREALATPTKPLHEPVSFGDIIDSYLECQEPCEDCIRRKAVLNTLDFCDKALDVDRTVESYKSLLTECYKVLPSIQPKPKTEWIPVSERLPETSGEYFITIDCGEGFLCTEFSWFYIDNKVWSYRNAKILAWMPLPKPYKAESEG